jgi:hypothetical protein
VAISVGLYSRMLWLSTERRCVVGADSDDWSIDSLQRQPVPETHSGSPVGIWRRGQMMDAMPRLLSVIG